MPREAEQHANWHAVFFALPKVTESRTAQLELVYYLSGICTSGEKQLVSLFSYVYLANPDRCMVIIDEPELSLSVEWQQSILEDVIKSGRCGSLIAATQSPFVYNNSLRNIAKALDTFLTVE
ncbi:MAG: ATP-binding protein [Clostridiales bacterium]|nr:ATP-binding protein [Clostridiales bacterium]